MSTKSGQDTGVAGGGDQAGQPHIEASYPKNRTHLSGGPRLGLIGWSRWFWRQLTSMRTALFLLLLLAIAAIPGSIFPQRGVDPTRVRQYILDNPEASVWLDRLHLFDVYASPWFAAIYLLLMISLVGCILPRSKQHLAAMRAQPPRIPARLTRMPAQAHATLVGVDPDQVISAAREVLRGRRFRIRDEEPGALVGSGEQGDLQGSGTRGSHIALLGVVVSVAAGSLFGWRGEIIVKERETFTTGVGTFDTIQMGALVRESSIPVFSFTLNALDVSFESQASGGQFGQPREFSGIATVQEGIGTSELQPGRTLDFAVNKPLSVGGVSMYLLGNGYAPIVTYTDTNGRILFQDAVTFLPQDNTYSSEGVIKVPAADLGFVGGFLPTIEMDPELGMTSSFPGLVDPALVLTAFEGDLYPDGAAQSVFAINTEEMEQVMVDEDTPFSLLLRPGEFIELPEDRGELEFEGVIRWAGLLVRHDPGRMPALIFSGVALAGLVLMLGVRRRRVFVRVDEQVVQEERHTGVVVAGLPKGTDPGLDSLIEDIMEQITTTSGGTVLEQKDDKS